MLEAIDGPEALRRLDDAELAALAEEIREVLIEAVSVNGGHLGSNLTGAVGRTRLVVPMDEAAAERTFCGDHGTISRDKT